jgi:hypothetical protein
MRLIKSLLERTGEPRLETVKIYRGKGLTISSEFGIESWEE